MQFHLPTHQLIGEYKSGGSDYRAAGCPDAVKVHDFVHKDLGKVAPYGIYDVSANAGWVSVGIDHDTAAFAVNSIRRWYDMVGRGHYNKAESAGIDPIIAMGREAHHPSLAERFQPAPAPPEDPTPLEAMAYRLQTPEGKKLYALRKQTPEPVFGIIKSGYL